MHIAKSLEEFNPGCHRFVSLPVDLSLRADLNFSVLQECVDRILSLSSSVFFEIDFGIDITNIQHPLILPSCQMALEKLVEFFPSIQAAVCLYKGKVPVDEVSFSQTIEHCEILIDFLHHVATVLPAEWPIASLFTSNDKYSSLAEIAQLFSRERLMQLEIGIKDCPLPIEGIAWGNSRMFGGSYGKEDSLEDIQATIGFVLPQDHLLEHERYTALLETVAQKYHIFRILPEKLITEQWDGLNCILFDPQAITRAGMRMLQGFVAAGGEVEEISG